MDILNIMRFWVLFKFVGNVGFFGFVCFFKQVINAVGFRLEVLSSLQ